MTARGGRSGSGSVAGRRVGRGRVRVSARGGRCGLGRRLVARPVAGGIAVSLLAAGIGRSVTACPGIAFPGTGTVGVVVDGQHGLDEEATERARAGGEPPSDHCRPLAHAGQPVTLGLAARRPRPAVAYPHVQRVVAVVQFHVDRGPGRVPADVGERLLHDPEGGQLHAGVQRRHVAAHDQAHARPGQLTCLVEEVGELPQTGLGTTVGRTVGVLAEHAQQPPHLDERGAGRVADRDQPARALVRHAGGGEAGGVRLQREHRDVVGHHVVEVAGDPGTFAAGHVGGQRVGHGAQRVIAGPGLLPRADHDAGRGRAGGDRQQDQRERASARTVVGPGPVGVDGEPEQEDEGDSCRPVAAEEVTDDTERDDTAGGRHPDDHHERVHRGNRHQRGRDRPEVGQRHRQGHRERQHDREPARIAGDGSGQHLGERGHGEQHADDSRRLTDAGEPPVAPGDPVHEAISFHVRHCPAQTGPRRCPGASLPRGILVAGVARARDRQDPSAA